MKRIAIYGGGGLGREVACLINRINEANPTWELIGFFDDGKEQGEAISHFGSVLGGLDDLNRWDETLCVVIAIGNPGVVHKISQQILNPRIEFPNLIHPNFTIGDSKTFCIGQGNIIQGGCSATCNVSIGNFNLLNSSVCLGHDDVVGSYNTFMPAVRISGEVHIGDCNFFGVGSIVLQQLKIGNNTRLGAGAVLMTKPKEGELYMGNPAKIFRY